MSIGGYAAAQDEFDETAEPAAEADSGDAADEGEAAAAPSGSKRPELISAEQAFDIRRGFFAEGEFGVFISFGGTNTNNPLLPSRSTSNLQPCLGVVVGYDVVTLPTFNLAVGAKVAMLLNGGAGRVTDADLNTPGVEATTKSNDFSILQAGGQLKADILLTDRVSLAIMADGGVALLDPDPTRTADDPSAGSSGVGGIFGAGAGVEYATLLNGFKVGLNIRFVGVLAGGLIPGAAITIPVKYNF